MKFINKLQGGGMTPYMVYTPNPGVPEQAPQTSKQSTKQEDPTKLQRDLLKDVFANALPSDAEMFFKELEGQLGALGSASSMEELLQSPSGMMKIQKMMTHMSHNKKDYENIEKELYNNGGLNEAAITERGEVIVMDSEGKMRKLGINEYNNNKDKFQIVTNSELLNNRSRNISNAFDSDSLNIAKNGLGLKNIDETIQQLTSKLQYQSNTSEEYLSEEDRAALQGLKALQKGDLTPEQKQYVNDRGQILAETQGADGVIKMTTKRSEANINAAINYIIKNLDNRQKNLLMLTASKNGATDLNKGAMEIITSYLQMTAPGDFSRTYSGGTASGSKGGGKSSGVGGADINFKTAVQQGLQNSQEAEYNLGGNVSMFTTARAFNSLLDTKGEAIPQGTNVMEAVQKSLPGIVDINTAWIGGQDVKTEMLNRTVYTGGKVATVVLPFVNKGGRIEPNYDVITRMSKVEKKIEDENITDPNIIAGLYDQAQVSQYINANPENTKLFAKFVQVPVYAPTAGVITDSNSPFVTQVKGAEEKAAEKLLAKGYTGKSDGDLDYKSMWVIDNVYKTNVFFHQTGSDVDAAINSGTITLPKTSLEEAITTRYKLDQKKKIAGAITGKDAYQ